jgi:hypothetical protein
MPVNLMLAGIESSGVVTELMSALFQASSLAATIPQVVELGAADFSPAHDLDFLNTRASEQKCALYTDTMTGNAAHSEIGFVSAAAQTDHHTLDHLNTFTVTFNDAHMHLDGISRRKLGMATIFGGQRIHQFVHG